jgi:CheY-like chemotaxis protein
VPTETLLVVDDDAGSRYVLGALLAETRYTVVEATSGAEGIRRARDERPAVIVLDLAMPDLSGIEVVRRLSSDPATRHIPIVICSSQILGERERRDLLALPRVADIVSKEFRSREMAAQAMRHALARASHLAEMPVEAV